VEEFMHKVNISVRHLVEFILRSGSIDSGFFISSNRALEGTRVHQRIQKLRKKEVEDVDGIYKREVQLRTELEYNDICFCIEGRADGLVNIDRLVVIEEIKSTLLPLSQLKKDIDHWHWAQAKCYAYMYIISQEILSQEIITEISCALIYGHVETGEWITFTESFTFEDLSAFVLGLIKKYWDFAKMEVDLVNESRRTGQALAFPFKNYRIGQRELAVAVYASILKKKKLFTQAPTGIGKTMATLFSAVKALSEGHGEKIFYLTSKTVQRHLAEDALIQMSNYGLQMRSITLTAKDKICFRAEKRACNPVSCKYASGHFDRVNVAILDCILNETTIVRATVEAYARKHQVCPSEYALDLSVFCQVVICDYNHVYDPKAKLKRFFQDGGKSTATDFILLHDEAHNLLDRGREMFSVSIHRKIFASLRKALGRSHPLYKIFGEAAKKIRAISNPDSDAGEDSLHFDLAAFFLEEFTIACELWFKDNHDGNEGENLLAEEILSVYFTALDYIRVADVYDERYTIYKEPDYVRLFCLDPSHLLRLEQKKSRSCVFFSATLTPLPYFQSMLGGNNKKSYTDQQSSDEASITEDNDYLLRLSSPFPRNNLCLVVENRISTKYHYREQSLDAVAERLYTMIQAKVGNYMAFFPSYAYLNQVYERFTECYKDVNVIRQQQGAGDEDDFLTCFQENGNENDNSGEAAILLGFVVLGGIFSEGIDLKGRRLIGAAVIGVGLPQISQERNVIANYFTANGKKGFDYAYIYPGMNKVLQAAGRVIRTESDIGVVILIDSRYSESEYWGLFPEEWKGYIKLKGSDRLSDVLEAFWRDK